MVKPRLAEFQSLWPYCGRQRKMTETLDQKIGGMASLPPYPTLLADPLYEGKRDERKTWSTLHLISAENAGSSKQGHTCMMTEAQ